MNDTDRQFFPFPIQSILKQFILYLTLWIPFVNSEGDDLNVYLAMIIQIYIKKFKSR